MNKLLLQAPAKINLALDIKDKRDNGYHELEMIMQSIALADIITIRKNNSSDINISCSRNDLPEGQKNLAYQAAELMFKEAKLEQGVDILIEKKIPVAAGLGGGSADAAAVLRGINYLFNINFSREILKKLGTKIGMDVPFCLDGGTALATGMGEKITSLPDLSPRPLILINPPFQLNTVEVYNKYDRISKKEDLKVKVPTSKLVNIIKSRENIKGNEGWSNILEPIAERINGDIKKIKKILKKYKPEFVMMTGSGPTIFSILKNKDQGLKIKKSWPRKQDKVILTTISGKINYQAANLRRKINGNGCTGFGRGAQ